MLLHDNAPAYSVIRVRHILAQKMVALLNHPPYTLIWHLQTGSCFVDVDAMKDRVTAVLRSIPQKSFVDCFGCQTIVVADGDYFQGQ